MTHWQNFVTNQRELGVANAELLCIDLQPYNTSGPREARHF